MLTHLYDLIFTMQQARVIMRVMNKTCYLSQFTTDQGTAHLYTGTDGFPTNTNYQWNSTAQPGKEGALYLPRPATRNTEAYVYCLIQAPIGANIDVSVQTGGRDLTLFVLNTNYSRCNANLKLYRCHTMQKQSM